MAATKTKKTKKTESQRVRAQATKVGPENVPNATTVPITERDAAPDNPTSPSPAHEKAVNALGKAVEQADGVIGHSEILAVVNRKLIEVQGTRDVLI